MDWGVDLSDRQNTVPDANSKGPTVDQIRVGSTHLFGKSGTQVIDWGLWIGLAGGGLENGRGFGLLMGREGCSARSCGGLIAWNGPARHVGEDAEL